MNSPTVLASTPHCNFCHKKADLSLSACPSISPHTLSLSVCLSVDVSREDKLEVLERRCVESGLKTSDIWWYADLRRYGSVPHAGTVQSSSMSMILHGRVIADDCPALPCPALPCPALPCPALPRLALPCPALPCRYLHPVRPKLLPLLPCSHCTFHHTFLV